MVVIYNWHRAWNIWVGLYSLWLGYLHFHDPSPTSDSGHSRRLLRECFERIHVVEFLQKIHELEKKTLAVHLVIHTVHYCHQAFQPLHALLIANLNITFTTLKDFAQLPVRYHLGLLQTQSLGQVSSPSPNKLLPEEFWTSRIFSLPAKWAQASWCSGTAHTCFSGWICLS